MGLAIVFVYIGMWAFVVFNLVRGMIPIEEVTQFLLEFAGATGVMGMIVLLVVQNFFRKTEAQ